MRTSERTQIELMAPIDMPATALPFLEAASAERREGRAAIVGVDPGTDTGMALAVTDARGQRRLRYLLTATPAEAAIMLIALAAEPNLLIAIEDARLRQHYGTEERYIYRKLKGGYRVSEAELNRYKGRLLGAGAVRGISAMLVDVACRHGATVVRVTPGYIRTKVKDADFRRITGYDSRSNSHERDAAMLALAPIFANPADFAADEPVML